MMITRNLNPALLRKNGIENEVVSEGHRLEEVVVSAINLGYVPRMVLQTISAHSGGHIELYRRARSPSNFAAILSEIYLLDTFYLFIPEEIRLRKLNPNMLEAPQPYSLDFLLEMPKPLNLGQLEFSAHDLLEVIKKASSLGYMASRILQIPFNSRNGFIELCNDGGGLAYITSELTGVQFLYNLYINKNDKIKIMIPKNNLI